LIRVGCRLGEPFWRAAGERRVVLELVPEATVAEALNRLAEQFPDLGRLLRGEPLENQEVLGPMWSGFGGLPLQVFVNSRIVGEEAREEFGLDDGDRLYLFVPAVGG